MRTGAFSQLEEAAHLLRRTGFGALITHWTGGVPLALAFLVCWNRLASGPVSDSQCAAGALLLAVLLVWMNCWRAVFAGRLLRQLSGAPEAAWTRGRIWRLTALQAFLAATKPFGLIISLLVLFPFANTVAFYRIAAALSDREDLDAPQTIRAARAIAPLDSRQGWILLPLLLLLSLAVLGNLALAVAALPQLVRIFTGYESAFSRSNLFFVESPLFFAFVLTLSWLAFDPFVQAVYCVRCFQGESRETGQDIRAGLRQVRVALISAALFLLICAIPARAADAVPESQLKQSVQRTMQASEYAWRIPPPAAQATGKVSWFVSVTDRMISALKEGLKAAGRIIMQILDWIFDKLGVRPSSEGGAMPSAGLHWSIYILIALILAILAWVIWKRRLLQVRRQKTPAAEPANVVRLDEEGLTADRLPEEAWLELAEQCVRDGNLRLALRALFLANLAWLGRLEYLSIDPGKTNREYELELRKRARPFQEARELFGRNVIGFERAWYGAHPVSSEDLQEFRERSASMRSVLTPPGGEIAA